MADPTDSLFDDSGSPAVDSGVGPETPGEPLFEERPTEFIVRDAFTLGVFPLALAGVAGVLEIPWLGYLLMAVTVFVACFFRNPPRDIPGDERTVVSPADGRVIAVGQASLPDGTVVPRVGIFLSVFNVHVNRAPVAGRVVGLERGGERFRAAFDSRAEQDNVYCAMSLETLEKELVRVVQITGLIARRIVSHPVEGEWLQRGARYGLIRFGSRMDVYLPPGSIISVARRQKVRAGSSELGRLPELESEDAGARTREEGG